MPDNDKSILLIDDDELFTSVLGRALSRRGWQPHVAHGMEHARQLADDVQPTYIVLDLNLSAWAGQEGRHGLVLIDSLRKSCPDARIVLLTGYASIATAVEAIKLGATNYLAKPVDVDSLLAAFNERSDASHSADSGRSAPPAPLEPLSVDRLEWEHIQRVLLEHDGNISATARALKMHRRTLQRKLAKHPAKA